MASKFGVRGVIFFEDYPLYARCKLAAVEQRIKVTDFIAACCEKYINQKWGATKDYKNSDSLYIDCKKVARQENISTAEMIEKACAVEFGIDTDHRGQVGEKTAEKTSEAQRKGSFLDLNRDARKQ